MTKKDVQDDRIEILVEMTDYAHYLYCANVENLGRDHVHIIHTAALVCTNDSEIIFGRMGRQTSRAGIYQLCGGGIDNNDIADEIFDFENNITNELREELGIDVQNKDFVKEMRLAYFKEGGPTDKMTVIYRVDLNMNANEFDLRYKKFEKELEAQGELPEFEEVIYLKDDPSEIRNFMDNKYFIFDEYMKPLFKYLASK